MDIPDASEIFKAKQQLVVVELFGAPAKLAAL
jgi:hypothetical protein